MTSMRMYYTQVDYHQPTCLVHTTWRGHNAAIVLCWRGASVLISYPQKGSCSNGHVSKVFPAGRLKESRSVELNRKNGDERPFALLRAVHIHPRLHSSRTMNEAKLGNNGSLPTS